METFLSEAKVLKTEETREPLMVGRMAMITISPLLQQGANIRILACGEFEEFPSSQS